MGEKSLTELMQELAALEDNAHNLADAQGAIRAKEREILKAFATAYEELKELFEGANIEPIVKAVQAKVAEDNAHAIEAIDAHIGEVVEQAKKNLDDAKIQVAGATAALDAKLADVKASIDAHGTTLEALQTQVDTIAEHPALAVPEIEPAATDTAKTD